MLANVPPAFFDRYLPTFRFSGEVWACDEGTPIFPQEPLLRVTAPILEAQLVETALLAIVGFQTTIASKAVRIVEMAAGRPVVEFGGRRAHGTEAAMNAARAAYLAGCAATSNAEAGRRYGIPLSGTMAHSWVMTFADELEAFKSFYALYGEDSVLLIDTYDTLAAARTIVASGLRPAAVRLDSGNIVELSRQVRQILDAGGLAKTGIFVSGDLDEYKIASFLSQGAPLSGFGVGTSLSTSRDAPALGGIYKLVEVERRGELVATMKLSPGKRSLPGRKQVWRTFEGHAAAGDILALADEAAPAEAVPLLKQVMAGGRRLVPRRPLGDVRVSCREQVSRLPTALRGLAEVTSYPVVVSRGLERLERRVNERLDRLRA
jgi:nicotinate phosphoribosyltransferase